MAEDSSSTQPQLSDSTKNSEGVTEQSTGRSTPRQWNEVWEFLLRLGLGEAALRMGTVLASITLVLLVLWVMGTLYLKGNVIYERDTVLAAALPTPTATIPRPDYSSAAVLLDGGVPRRALLHTNLPVRSQVEITQYQVEQGDTIYGIAEKFGLQPQTILWANQDTLQDDPHNLQPGQTLNILPVNGAIYDWHAGDGLNGVSQYFSVTPEDIINWPGNGLSPETIGDYTNPNIEPGKRLVIPGGTRPFISWSAPVISRTDPAKAKIFGPGYCGSVIDGPIGSGTFVWPSVEHYLSGYDYSPETNHWGIDIAGQTGNPIYATDSGVVVFAGWNDSGYGNVIVIDHGNGWQSLYAHLSELYVGCGASVAQGASIAGMGSTGRSTGPHLHFEIMNSSGVRVNPWNYVSK